MVGQLEAIFIAPARGAAIVAVDRVLVIASAGLAGDRYCSADSKRTDRNVTLVEVEEIERYNAEYGQAVGAGQTRRNLVTRGIRLCELQGRTFRVGSIVLRGAGLCEPCRTFGANLQSDSQPARKVVRAFLQRAGLCATAVTGGQIFVGDKIFSE
jgi:MOSC domain-containing protein YiiM